MTSLDDLREIARLRRALKARQGIDASRAEEAFLFFCSVMALRTLVVSRPALYPLSDLQMQKYNQAVAKFGVKNEGVAIDISGASDLNFRHDLVVFVSYHQLESDHISREKSYMNPLIEKIYSDALLITDFTIHEAIVGLITQRRGELDLGEISLFPHAFTPGPYQIQVSLDTPLGTISGFRDLERLLDDFKTNPQAALLDPRKIKEVADKATILRNRLGSLSRYEVPVQDFSVSANSCFVRNEESRIFYLYAQNTNRNFAVYFGNNPFNVVPINLAVINGGDHQAVLPALVESGIYEISLPVLHSKIADLEKMFGDAARVSNRSLAGQYETFERLLSDLKVSYRALTDIVNPEMAVKYALALPPELLEFMIYPLADDPLHHLLLPMLSWNRSIRRYHDTYSFMEEFAASDELAKVAMLQSITSSALFANYQNRDVNFWLYVHHKDFCEQAGIVFDVQK